MFAILLVLCVGFAVAIDFNASDFCNEEISEEFVLPNKVPFSDEVVNVYLADESIGYIVLEDKVIESYGCGENEKPTYKIFVRDEKVIDDILDAEDKVGEYNKQRGDGGLRIEAVGFWRGAKLFFINFFSRFF